MEEFGYEIVVEVQADELVEMLKGVSGDLS